MESAFLAVTASWDDIFGEDATVIRGGYGRVYGRLNGVGLVLTPLLGPGLIQAVQCRTATVERYLRIFQSNGHNGVPYWRRWQHGSARGGYYRHCLNLSIRDTTARRSATAAMLDPTFRPNDVDSFNLTIQRQINRKMLVEVGYIGRIIHNEFQPLNINTVPYMMSLGGQSFASAYAAVETAFGCATSAGLCNATTRKATTGRRRCIRRSPAQAFFETALAGTGYCAGYANCTTAVVQKEASHFGNQQVFDLWSDLDNGGFNFARSMMGTPIPGQTQWAGPGRSGAVSA